MDLKSEQKKLFALLNTYARCFVRVCDDDRALWVSDLPRKSQETLYRADELLAEGFCAWEDEAQRLLYVDLSLNKWQELIDSLPCKLPALPKDETLHTAYALCRLWMLHPTQRADEHMPMLRTAAKLVCEAPSKTAERKLRTLYEESAVRLRNSQTLPCDAGRLLAAWINNYDSEKEMRI